jgi:hypothetical protein
MVLDREREDCECEWIEKEGYFKGLRSSYTKCLLASHDCVVVGLYLGKSEVPYRIDCTTGSRWDGPQSRMSRSQYRHGIMLYIGRCFMNNSRWFSVEDMGRSAAWQRLLSCCLLVLERDRLHSVRKRSSMFVRACNIRELWWAQQYIDAEASVSSI